MNLIDLARLFHVSSKAQAIITISLGIYFLLAGHVISGIIACVFGLWMMLMTWRIKRLIQGHPLTFPIPYDMKEKS
jgi:hypothetical protein